MKVATRGGQTNVYALDLTEATDGLVPVLEEFLRDHRPKMRGAADSPYLFLTNVGRPFSQHGLRTELMAIVALRIGKRFYPHLIRSIAATECLEETHDIPLAAEMLGDTNATMLNFYHRMPKKAQYQKHRDFTASALKPPAPATEEAAD